MLCVFGWTVNGFERWNWVIAPVFRVTSHANNRVREITGPQRWAGGPPGVQNRSVYTFTLSLPSCNALLDTRDEIICKYAVLQVLFYFSAIKWAWVERLRWLQASPLETLLMLLIWCDWFHFWWSDRPLIISGTQHSSTPVNHIQHLTFRAKQIHSRWTWTSMKYVLKNMQLNLRPIE